MTSLIIKIILCLFPKKKRHIIKTQISHYWLTISELYFVQFALNEKKSLVILVVLVQVLKGIQSVKLTDVMR